jgi:ABC-2 type transport system ATP-binding protein
VAVATLTPAIEAVGLTKRYGPTLAVDDLNLTLWPGEIFGLLGPNGAGKTTTILMLLGLSEPTAGRARVLGLDPGRQPLQVKRRVGYVPDDVGFYGALTGRENLRYTARLNGLGHCRAEELIGELLRDVGLDEAADARVETYSRGMRQRLGLADALVKEPNVAILDEPTVGIDPEGVEEILALISSLAHDRGATVLLSSHLLHQVQSICDRVGIFVSGRMITEGPVRELADAVAGGTVTIEVEVDDGDVHRSERRLDGMSGVRQVLRDDRDPTRFRVVAEHDIRPEVARTLVEAGVGLRHLHRREEELDELYRRYFRESRDGD